MTSVRGDDGVSQVGQVPSNTSKKDEEKRKHFLLTNVLGLKSQIQHPVINTLLQKYVKQNISAYDKSAFRLDVLRMLALHRISSE